VTISVDDGNLLKLMTGQLNPQQVCLSVCVDSCSLLFYKVLHMYCVYPLSSLEHCGMAQWLGRWTLAGGLSLIYYA